MADIAQDQEQDYEVLMNMLREEHELKKNQQEPRRIPDLKEKLEELKTEYSKNYDKYIDVQSKIQLLKRLGLYDGQSTDELQKSQNEFYSGGPSKCFFELGRRMKFII
ncbi:Hypothetical_protein [Hexamita inflata]|uniref:Hypothetical_protein n=1 Tax=Hexamita inflata TaxID=28002 RepID=A0ABP1LJT2_9EUKA